MFEASNWCSRVSASRSASAAPEPQIDVLHITKKPLVQSPIDPAKRIDLNHALLHKGKKPRLLEEKR
jgi:hypothetical protein